MKNFNVRIEVDTPHRTQTQTHIHSEKPLLARYIICAYIHHTHTATTQDYIKMILHSKLELKLKSLELRSFYSSI